MSSANAIGQVDSRKNVFRICSSIHESPYDPTKQVSVCSTCILRGEQNSPIWREKAAGLAPNGLSVSQVEPDH